MTSVSSINSGTGAPRFSDFVEQELRRAGWYPGRTVEEVRLRQWAVIPWEAGSHGSGQIRIFPAALRALREFGDLLIVPDKPDSAGPDIFRIDPLTASEFGLVDDRWAYEEWVLETALFPIISMPKYFDCTVAIDVRGQVFELGYGYRLIGETMDLALGNMIRGTQPAEIFTKEEQENRRLEAEQVGRLVAHGNYLP